MSESSGSSQEGGAKTARVPFLRGEEETSEGSPRPSQQGKKKEDKCREVNGAQQNDEKARAFHPERSGLRKAGEPITLVGGVRNAT